jgi:hypothetical protein
MVPPAAFDGSLPVSVEKPSTIAATASTPAARMPAPQQRKATQTRIPATMVTMGTMNLLAVGELPLRSTLACAVIAFRAARRGPGYLGANSEWYEPFTSYITSSLVCRVSVVFGCIMPMNMFCMK